MQTSVRTVLLLRAFGVEGDLLDHRLHISLIPPLLVLPSKAQQSLVETPYDEEGGFS